MPWSGKALVGISVDIYAMVGVVAKVEVSVYVYAMVGYRRFRRMEGRTIDDRTKDVVPKLPL